MNQEQLLARRDELVRQYHLGELELYCTPWTYERWAIYAIVLVFVAALALLFWIALLYGQAPYLPYAGLGALMGCGFYVAFFSDQTSVYVYTNGLVWLWPSGGRVVHWGEIRKVWIAGGGRRGAVVLNVKLNDGAKFRFPPYRSRDSASNKELKKFIEGKIYR